MEALGMILLGIGVIVSAVGGIWFLVVAFQESVLWGLCCLFVPFAALVFLIKFWDRAARPFFVQLAALVPIVAGMLLAGQ
jgi:hypothetical protein